jgi:hypothetical protein
MNRQLKNKKYDFIRQAVLKYAPDYWYDCSYWNGVVVGYTARTLNKIFAKQHKYFVRVEEIKHSLKDLKHSEGVYYIPLPQTEVES